MTPEVEHNTQAWSNRLSHPVSHSDGSRMLRVARWSNQGQSWDWPKVIKKEYKHFFFLDVNLEKSMLKLLQHLNIMKDEIKCKEEAELIFPGLDPWTFQLSKKQMNLCTHK